MKNKVFIVLVIIFLSHLLFRIYALRENYTIPFSEAYWSRRFEMSQWSPTPGCKDQDPHVNPYTCKWDDTWEAKNKFVDQTLIKKNDIGDDGLYTYVAWNYIKGGDPTLLNAETPPFGKYIIGATIVLFKNQNVFGLLTGLLALGALYVFNFSITKDRFSAFVPVLLFSLEPLFYTQLGTTYLDLLYLSLLLFTFLFLFKKKYFVSTVFLGLMAATKASLSTFILVITATFTYILLSDLLTKKKHPSLVEMKKYLLHIPVAGVVFACSYIVYFLKGNNFLEFLGVQKWIMHFYASGAKGNVEAFWQMFFMGRYETWYGTTETVREWHVGWIIIFFFTLYEIFLFLKQRKFETKTLILIWVMIYSAFLFFVPVWPRYLLLLLPFMYNLSVWRIVKSTTGTTSTTSIKNKI